MTSITLRYLRGVKISVVTINLNNQEGLDKTIRSVLDQDYPDLEHIVIDGGSSDRSVDTIKRFAHQLGYWISEPDKGIYDAQNKGTMRAKGDYIIFLNSGDYFYSDGVLSDLIAQGENADIIYGDIIYKNGEGERILQSAVNLDFRFFLNHSLPHPSTLIRKSLFTTCGPYHDEMKIRADWAFFMDAICKHGASSRHVKLIVSVFILGGITSTHDGGLLGSKEREEYLIKNYSSFYDDFKKLFLLEERMQVLQNSKTVQSLSVLLPERLRKMIYQP